MRCFRKPSVSVLEAQHSLGHGQQHCERRGPELEQPAAEAERTTIESITVSMCVHIVHTRVCVQVRACVFVFVYRVYSLHPLIFRRAVV